MREIWSGGQTGVDRAALDAALGLGIPIGGWVPRGRRAEDGRIPDSYAGLRETAGAKYRTRTSRNVRDTDATLILHFGAITGGTAVAFELAQRLEKPILTVDLETVPAVAAARQIREWIAGLAPEARINIAGPRESTWPGAYGRARDVLVSALAFWSPRIFRPRSR